ARRPGLAAARVSSGGRVRGRDRAAARRGRARRAPLRAAAVGRAHAAHAGRARARAALLRPLESRRARDARAREEAVRLALSICFVVGAALPAAAAAQAPDPEGQALKLAGTLESQSRYADAEVVL